MSKNGGFMNQKYILTALCAVLSINTAISASTSSSSLNDSLKKVLSFINGQTNQASPVFDYSAKPRFEHVKAALDQIIQKATDDQALSNNADESINNIILLAREHQEILQQLYKENPNRFLSDAELQKPNQRALALPTAQDNFPNEQQMLREQTNSPYLEYTLSEDSEPSTYASEPYEQGELHEEDNDNEFYYDYLSE